MASEPQFRTDLYSGTARFYDDFRVPYPQYLLTDLCVTAKVTGAGQLLDIACGTGQISFGLWPHFAEVWAVDQELEMVELARVKASERGVKNVPWSVGRAEEVEAENCIELVAIGNAFHRLRRRSVAESARRWLVRGGHLALLWSNTPWCGSAQWQQVMSDTLDDWARKAAASNRVPANVEQSLAEEPNTSVLAAAGFAIVGKYEFLTPYEWTIEKLTGFTYSTSLLSREALGPHIQAFESDLREGLMAVEPSGLF